MYTIVTCVTNMDYMNLVKCLKISLGRAFYEGVQLMVLLTLQKTILMFNCAVPKPKTIIPCQNQNIGEVSFTSTGGRGLANQMYTM